VRVGLGSIDSIKTSLDHQFTEHLPIPISFIMVAFSYTSQIRLGRRIGGGDALTLTSEKFDSPSLSLRVAFSL